MASFNFMDTFFFLSLGITFVLILLIVYHFKQSLTSMEQKNDTMFEIIQNMAKESLGIKANMVQLYEHVNSRNMPMFFPSHDIAKEFVINGNMNATEQVYAPASECQILNDEDEDDEDEDDEDEDEDEDEDDEDDEDDDDEDDDDDVKDDDDAASILYTGEEVECDWPVADPEYKKIVVHDDTTDEVDVPEESSKEILINDFQSQQLTTHSSLEPIADIKVINIEENIVEEKTVFDEVEKISSNETVISEVEPTTTTNRANEALEIYKKMNMNVLKAEVVSKGLCSDASKLKKVDIMKLLEKYHNEQ